MSRRLSGQAGEVSQRGDPPQPHASRAKVGGSCHACAFIIDYENTVGRAPPAKLSPSLDRRLRQTEHQSPSQEPWSAGQNRRAQPPPPRRTFAHSHSLFIATAASLESNLSPALIKQADAQVLTLDKRRLCNCSSQAHRRRTGQSITSLTLQLTDIQQRRTVCAV